MREGEGRGTVPPGAADAVERIMQKLPARVHVATNELTFHAKGFASLLESCIAKPLIAAGVSRVSERKEMQRKIENVLQKYSQKGVAIADALAEEFAIGEGDVRQAFKRLLSEELNSHPETLVTICFYAVLAESVGTGVNFAELVPA
jgi:hypothetical protein